MSRALELFGTYAVAISLALWVIGVALSLVSRLVPEHTITANRYLPTLWIWVFWSGATLMLLGIGCIIIRIGVMALAAV